MPRVFLQVLPKLLVGDEESIHFILYMRKPGQRQAPKILWALSLCLPAALPSSGAWCSTNSDLFKDEGS